TGAAAIDLAGWVLDDGNSVFHEAATIAAGSIAAGESAVLFNADDLTAEAFAAAWGGGLNLIAVADWSANTLNNGGDVIALWDSFEAYSTDIAGEAIAFDEAVAVVAYDDGGDWPADDGDASIYLTDLAADPNDGANWALSTVGDATPTGVGRDSVPDAASGNEGDVGSPGGDPVADPGSIEIVINEILADPAADLPGDANGDGTRDATQDEFVEIVNAGDAPADLSGFTLSDGVQARHVFPEGSVIAPGEALVVFGGGTPSGAFGGATVQLASTGALGLNNGGDAVTIAAPDETVVASVEYGSEGGDDQSLTRDPQLEGDFVAHSEAVGSDGALFSPGEILDGDGGGGGGGELLAALISDIQGSSAGVTKVGLDDRSPLEGQLVSITAVVTADFQTGGLGGFFVQEEDADQDADASTSEGIFIFEGSLVGDVNVNVGDLVTVTGIVGEAFGQTQISASSVEVIESGVDLPTATVVDLGATGAIEDDDSGVDYVVNLEAFEGMRVTFPEDLTISEMFNLDRFGEYRLSSEGRPFQFTQLNDPDVEGFDAHLQDVAARSIVLDDGLTAQNPFEIEVIDGNDGILGPEDSVRMGDTIANVTGVLRYGFDEYRIDDATGDYSSTNPRPESPEDVGGDFKVASLNVLNFFTTLDTTPGGFNGPNNSGPEDDIEPRGANSPEEL
ncbi:MAG: lamin tail domain-containing protein, partial [Pseudomonadota bacterium]